MLQGDLIVGLVPEGCIPDGLISVPKQGYMTGLIMLGYALHAAAADSISDILYFTDTLAGQVVGHGCRGREEVTNLKMEYFRPCTEKGLLTYRYLDFFCVDLENSCVQFGFSCLIPGSEGRGTEFLHFDEVSYPRQVRHLLPDIQDGKISNILHVRHALTQQAWVTHQIQYIPQNSVSSFYYEFLARPAGHGAGDEDRSAARAWRAVMDASSSAMRALACRSVGWVSRWKKLVPRARGAARGPRGWEEEGPAGEPGRAAGVRGARAVLVA